MSLTSPPESGFTPRREFLRDPPVTPNAFSLLAISGPNCLRLYSFPPPLLIALRKLLDHQNLVTTLREDVDQQFCEIVLAGKPWNSAKSVLTEKLLVEILAVIYQHSYTYLSTIDYGRESDDRLAIAFSRPATRSVSPMSPSDSPQPNSLASSKHSRRVPFALSFTSATLLRVVAPPLHSTPAILQAVRKSWPRGVVAEKKVADNCFEFKLKGYKWFHEDTFATDSLRHILSLLSSLDANSFSLLASISLTSRSRVKDLWIFTGPASSSIDSLPDSPAPSVLNGSHNDFRRVVPASQSPIINPKYVHSQQSPHHKLASEPAISAAPIPPAPGSHARAATDTSPGSSSHSPVRNSTINLLRKPAPRAQVPVSVHDPDAESEPLRTHMPSIVSGSAENLTGIGAGRTPDVFYSTSPLGHSALAEDQLPLLVPENGSRSRTPSSHRNSEQTPPFLGSRSHSPSPSPQPAVVTPLDEQIPAASVDVKSAVATDSPTGTMPLLGPNAFRDSAFSSGSNSTYDMPIPIKWTGMGRDASDETKEQRESLGPSFPGGWQPTPIEEKPEELEGYTEDDLQHNPNLPTPDIQEVPQRLGSLDPASHDITLRKSEAGLVGLIAASENADNARSEGEGKGWVVIDVEGRGSVDGVDKVVASPVSESHSPASPYTPVKDGTKSRSGSGAGSPTAPPIAKAIAAMDAIESKSKPAPSPLRTTSPDSTGGLKRFFSLGRNSDATPPPRRPTGASAGRSNDKDKDKNPSQNTGPGSGSSKQVVSEDDTKRAIELVHGASHPKPHAKEKESKPKMTRLRDRLRLIGTPEASRNEDKRRSLH